MEFYDVVKTRRCIRDYKPDAVPDEVLARVLEAARMSPVANAPYRVNVVVLKDPGARSLMASLCSGQKFVASAPVILVVCAENVKPNRGGYMKEYGMLVDGAILADHITLAARAENLATCWIGSFDNEGIKKFLSIPAAVNVAAVIPAGYPSSEAMFAPPGHKRGFKDMFFPEKWREG